MIVAVFGQVQVITDFSARYHQKDLKWDSGKHLNAPFYHICLFCQFKRENNQTIPDQ